MFEITITETATETQVVGGEWAVTGKRLVSEKDIQDSAYNAREELKQKLLSGAVVMMEERGYTPKIEKEVQVNHKIYNQTVESLDLAAVIKAINNL